MFSEAEIFLGGSGINYDALPEEVEHSCPDYQLYDLDYSLGFTSRGCIRACPWCVVPKKEGQLREHAPIKEFLHPNHRKLLLLDNNFLASPLWESKLQELIDSGIKVSFNQGLDIRLVNEDNAKLLKETHYYDSDFNERRLYFSFDLPQIEAEVVKGVQILNDAGIRSSDLMFYILCGYNTTHREDLWRFDILNDLGVDPFVMIYNNRRDDRWLRNFARWVNQRVYKKCNWLEYDYGDSQKWIKEAEP